MHDLANYYVNTVFLNESCTKYFEGKVGRIIEISGIRFAGVSFNQRVRFESSVHKWVGSRGTRGNFSRVKR